MRQREREREREEMRRKRDREDVRKAMFINDFDTLHATIC